MLGDSAPSRRRWLVRLLLVVVSSTLTAAVLEVAAAAHLGDRFVRGAELGNNWKIAGRRDASLGWTGRPGAIGRIVDRAMDYTVHLNGHGMRDPERVLQKPAGTRRVVVLGDSVTWGWGIQQGERYTDLLEQRLEPETEVINLACPGYGTDQQYWTLIEQGFAYEPDAVLLCFIINDIPEAESTERYGMPKPRFEREADGAWVVRGRPVEVTAQAEHGLWKRLVRHSALLTLVTGRPLATASELELEEVRYSDKPRHLAPIHAAADKVVDESTVTWHLLGRIRDACAERSIPLLITTVAHKHDQYLYEPLVPAPEEATVAEAPFRSYFTQRVAAACEALGVPFVPVDDLWLEDTRAGVRLHVGDGHPNARGHELIADRVEPALRALLGM